MPNNNNDILRKVFGAQPESETAYLAAWTICKVSGHDDKNLVRAIVTYFENFACFVELMKWIVTREVESMHVSEGTVPFREDSVSTALLLHFGQTSPVCLAYLRERVSPTTKKIKAISDQQQRGIRDGMHPDELLNLCKEVIDSVTSNPQAVPPPHLAIMKHVAERVRDLFGNTRVATAAIVTVFLLRFVVRSITFPEHYFAKKKVSFAFRKNLTKVGKVLQKLSSIEDEATGAGEASTLDIPDADPEVVAEFVRVNRRKLKTFFEQILATPVTVLPQRWGADGGMRMASRVIVAHITDNADRLYAEVPQLFPNNKTKSRANSLESDREILEEYEALDNLNACLLNPQARDIFFRFSAKEFSESPLLFWIEADKYSKNPTIEYATDIFSKFLENGGIRQMDFEKNAKQSVRESIQRGEVDATLFAKVQNVAFKNMACDSFPRFVESVKANKP